MTAYTLHHRDMSGKPVFYAETLEDAKAQARKWLALCTAAGSGYEGYRLLEEGKKEKDHSELESSL